MIISFADMLKYNCILNDEETLYHRDSKKLLTIDNCENIWHNYFCEKPENIRSNLQQYGCFKRDINDEIWISMLYITIMTQKERGISLFLIPDVRFENEYKFIKNVLNGYVIRIVAPIRNNERTKLLISSTANHKSELGLEQCPMDFDLDNDGDNFTINGKRLLDEWLQRDVNKPSQ
tara:strand:- start:4182 stop:4712 length:531 start_codon:yes stop_codon:yes gene_type:complete